MALVVSVEFTLPDSFSKGVEGDVAEYVKELLLGDSLQMSSPSVGSLGVKVKSRLTLAA